jgi:integrase/recombinase XerC
MFITSCLARSESRARYGAWLRYTLGYLVEAFKTLPTRPEPLEELLVSIRGKRKEELSQATKVDIWGAWRMLYLWAEERVGAPNAMKAVQKPRRRKTRKPALSQPQVERLVSNARQRGARDHALIRVLVDAGPRIGELKSLTWTSVSWQIDTDGSTVYTLELPDDGKRGARDVPILPETFRALQRLASLNGGNTLWTGRRGPLTTWGLQGIVRKALAEIGVTGGPHMLRHTFARLFLRRGGNLLVLQEILGHADLGTTSLYLDIPGEVREQHARFSPLAGMAEQ